MSASLSDLNFARKKRLPVILQTEMTECGLACIAMVAKYHGHKLDLNGLRARFPISQKGATLDTLINISGELDLGTRALRLDMNDMKKLQLPAILHWDLNHFVVLKKVHGQKITIHDPARGERVMHLREASDHFTGVALELTPSETFTKQKMVKKLKLKQLWTRLIGLKRAILQTLTLSIVLQIIVLAMPFYLQLVIDEVVVKYDLRLLVVLALAFGALVAIQSLTTMMRSWTILYFGHQMSFQMVANVFRHLIHLPADYFEKRHVGDIMSRMRSTKPIQEALTQSVVVGIIDGLMAIITGIVIFLYSPFLGMIVLVSAVLLVLVTVLYYPMLRMRQEEAIITEALTESHVIESIRASTTIKLFSAQNQRLAIWRNLYADTINANVSYGKYEIFLKGAKDLIDGIQTVLIVYFGATLILDDASLFTVGMLFAFMSYRLSFTNSVMSLLEKAIEFRLLNLHLERIADIALSEPEDLRSDVGVSDEQLASPAKIEFNDVSFRYSSTDPWVLQNVNLTIEAGEFVALTGISGGGKTTMMKLMLGLYAPTEGQILIDGFPLTNDNRMAWRERIGVVMQDDQLLTGSIAENISFFDTAVNMEDVHRAAMIAHIHDDIVAMPMNYLSYIGDMGSIFSGGQRQRLLLARALYRRPKTLFLDEGTANLDEETEKLIVDIIKKSDLTRVVVAHRPEFIKNADRIIEIKDQGIAEQG